MIGVPQVFSDVTQSQERLIVAQKALIVKQEEHIAGLARSIVILEGMVRNLEAISKLDQILFTNEIVRLRTQQYAVDHS